MIKVCELTTSRRNESSDFPQFLRRSSHYNKVKIEQNCLVHKFKGKSIIFSNFLAVCKAYQGNGKRNDSNKVKNKAFEINANKIKKKPEVE